MSRRASSSSEHGLVNPRRIWQLVLSDRTEKKVPQDASDPFQPTETLLVHFTPSTMDQPGAIVVSFAEELAKLGKFGRPHKAARAVNHPVEHVVLLVLQEKKRLKRDPGVNEPIFERPPASGGHRRRMGTDSNTSAEQAVTFR